MATSQVTIGVPVYNGALTLRRAVESAVQQTHPHCVILISDNGSTDGTAEIGAALAAAYPNVSYFRQPKNLGSAPNFRYLLQQAKTPYFMWLAADDYLMPTYIEKTLAELERDPGVVTCVSQVRFVRADGSVRPSRGTYPLQGAREENLFRYLTNPDDNSRVYGLHRTEAMCRAFPVDDFLVAHDWAIMGGMLLHGRHAEIGETLLIRDDTPHFSYMLQIRNTARSVFERWIPLLPMTRDLVFRQKLPLTWPIVKALIYINISLHFQYASAFFPRYARIEPFFSRHLLWRLTPWVGGSRQAPIKGS